MSNQTDPTRAALEALYFSFEHKDTGNPANRKGNQAKTDIITHNQDVRDALTLARNVIYNKHTPDKTTNAELLNALEQAFTMLRWIRMWDIPPSYSTGAGTQQQNEYERAAAVISWLNDLQKIQETIARAKNETVTDSAREKLLIAFCAPSGRLRNQDEPDYKPACTYLQELGIN